MGLHCCNNTTENYIRIQAQIHQMVPYNATLGISSITTAPRQQARWRETGEDGMCISNGRALSLFSSSLAGRLDPQSKSNGGPPRCGFGLFFFSYR